MGRTYACVCAAIIAVGTLALAGLQGCLLINLDAFDAVGDASRGPGGDASDGAVEASKSSASDAAPEVSEDDSPATDEEPGQSDASDESQGADAADVARPNEAGEAGGRDGRRSPTPTPTLHVERARPEDGRRIVVPTRRGRQHCAPRELCD